MIQSIFSALWVFLTINTALSTALPQVPQAPSECTKLDLTGSTIGTFVDYEADQHRECLSKCNDIDQCTHVLLRTMNMLRKAKLRCRLFNANDASGKKILYRMNECAIPREIPRLIALSTTQQVPAGDSAPVELPAGTNAANNETLSFAGFTFPKPHDFGEYYIKHPDIGLSDQGEWGTLPIKGKLIPLSDSRVVSPLECLGICYDIPECTHALFRFDFEVKNFVCCQFTAGQRGGSYVYRKTGISSEVLR